MMVTNTLSRLRVADEIDAGVRAAWLRFLGVLVVLGYLAWVSAVLP